MQKNFTLSLHEHRLLGFARADELQEALDEFDSKEAPTIHSIEDADAVDSETKRSAMERMEQMFEGTWTSIKSYFRPQSALAGVVDQIAKERMEQASKELLASKGVVARKLELQYRRTCLGKDLLRERSLVLRELSSVLEKRKEHLREHINRYESYGSKLKLGVAYDKELLKVEKEADKMATLLRETEKQIDEDEEKDTQGVQEGKDMNNALRAEIISCLDLKNPMSMNVVAGIDQDIARAAAGDKNAMDSILRVLEREKRNGLKPAQFKQIMHLFNEVTDSRASLRYMRSVMRERIIANDSDLPTRLEKLLTKMPLGQRVRISGKVGFVVKQDLQRKSIIVQIANGFAILDANGESGSHMMISRTGKSAPVTQSLSVDTVRKSDGTFKLGYRDVGEDIYFNAA